MLYFGALFFFFLIKIAYFVQFNNSFELYLHTLDSEVYLDMAQEIHDGKVIFAESFNFNPYYPYFLACFKLLSSNLHAVRILQFIFGMATAIFLFLYAKEKFSERVAIIATLLYLFTPTFLFYENTYLPVSHLVLFFILFLYSLEKERYLTSGVFFGLALLIKPNVLIFLAYFVYHLHRKKSLTDVRKSLVFLSFPFIFSGLTVVHNYLAEEDFVFIASHGGINFYMGNHEGATGGCVDLAGITTAPGALNLYDAKNVAEKESGRTLKSSEMSAFWFRKGLDFARNNVIHFVSLTLRKFYYIFHKHEIPLNFNFKFVRSNIPLLYVLFINNAILSACFFLSLASVRKVGANRSVDVFILFSLSAISIVLFFISSRYRILCTLMLLMPAAVFIEQFVSFKKLKMIYCSALFLFLCWCFCIPLSIEPHGFSTVYNNLGRAYAQQGDWDRAIGFYEKSLSEDPQKDIIALFNLSVAHLEKSGRRINRHSRKAFDGFRYILEEDPEFYNVYNVLGVFYLTSDKEKSKFYFEKSLGINKHQPRIHGLLRGIDK